ncbi:MAG: hypothetical protein LUG19_13505 [Desulfovibrio sp.]|uniref:hypothetical protein n=1 Tax=Desulfovibrio sp. TaxID=885 RepID=UPI0025911496|nr:hypothetical protein [Desulfovibrio sp.]MCD7985243.1 hypothetical protein [Desulfovibrio sp.]
MMSYITKEQVMRNEKRANMTQYQRLLESLQYNTKIYLPYIICALLLLIDEIWPSKYMDDKLIGFLLTSSLFGDIIRKVVVPATNSRYMVICALILYYIIIDKWQNI